MATTTPTAPKLDDMTSFLREAIFIVFYHKNLIVTLAVATFLIFLSMAILLPPKYMCQAKFTVSMPQQLDPLHKETSYDTKNQYLRMLTDQKEVIMSNRVLTRVAKQIWPDKNEDQYEKLTDELLKDIEMAPPKGESFEATNVYYVRYENSNPQLAFDLMNTLAEVYLDTYAEISGARTEYSYEFYKKQVESLNQLVRQKSEAIREYESANALALVDILSLDTSRGGSATDVGAKAQLNELNRKRQALLEEYMATAQAIAELEDDLATGKSVPTIMPDMEGSGKAMTAYKNKIAQLQMQINELNTQFTPSYEPLRRLKAELDSNITLMREELALVLKAKKISAEGMRTMIAEMDKTIAGLEDSVRNTAQQRSAYEALKNDYLLAKDAYSEARNKLEQARQATSLSAQKMSITMVDAPVMPTKPVKPKRTMIAVMGFFLGIFTGLMGAFVVDYFDHTLKNPEEVIRYLQLPCFGSLPHVEG